MKFGAFIVAVITALTATAVADSTFNPLKPPAIPLAVRSPYLSTWLMGDTGNILPGNWPKFWAGETTGWQGFIRVDNVTYNWMGREAGPQLVKQTSFKYTSTKSIFTFDVAGKVVLTATFLSPVFPDDLLRQSLQFSYLRLSTKSSDGGAHAVQVYADITGEWASDDSASVISWENGNSSGVGYHRFVLTTDYEVFTEKGDMARWGDWYFATNLTNTTTWRNGLPSAGTRALFANEGQLDNAQGGNGENSTSSGAIGSPWPVFAYAHDLGQVSGAEKDVLFVIGIAQNEVINFQGKGDGPESLAALWTIEYSTGAEAVAAFYNDWDYANQVASELDSLVQSDSVEAAGQTYASITTLSLRQAFGALQVAHGAEQDYIFLKEISSDGDIQTVDVIFPFHPVLLYLNAKLLKLLMDPIFENTEAGHYPQNWTIHDLGRYPNALGYPAGDGEVMPVEECGNMAIMVLAYAQRTGDNAYLAQHWPILDQWTQFLVQGALYPEHQLSTDDFAGELENQTNLALKGILGVAATAEIANRTGLPEARKKADIYRATAEDYISKWMTLGITNSSGLPHTTLAYGDDASHGSLYNLYADQLLKLQLVDQSVYDMQSNFYPTVMTELGLALDTRYTLAKADWEVFAAAIAGKDTQAKILSSIVKWLKMTNTNVPFTDLYDVNTGFFGGVANGLLYFKARPVVGGTFALLAL